MDRNILFIVEGESDEVKFIEKLFNVCYKLTEFRFFSYKTNIHTLAKKLTDNYPEFENDEIEINQFLLSVETDKHKREILKRKFTDVFMIFDFDPQHDSLQFNLIQRLVEYYTDSTCQGKLYINYPMMQSYKHFDRLPDPSFESRKVTIQDTYNYKKIVGSMSKYTDLNDYDYVMFYSLCVHHLKKANKIIYGCYSLPSKQEFLTWKESWIFEKQIRTLTDLGEINVLNTCIFILPEYAPEKFFLFVSKHSNDLYI